MADIIIRGVSFDWNSFSDLERGRFDCLKGCFGIYLFYDENEVLYIGISGRKSKQKNDLRDRIRQYFTKNDSGVSFPKRWMKRNGKDNYSDFLEFAKELELVTISTEEKSDHAVEIINWIEEFLIRKLDPQYNFKHYGFLCPKEKIRILSLL